jgi:hypothetical protein
VPKPGDEAVGRWVPFYHIDFGEDRLDYFYDGDSLISRGGHAFARWKVVGKAPATVTLTVTEIDCAAHTFSESATVLIDASGNKRAVPIDELYKGQPIVAGKSADSFARIACR